MIPDTINLVCLEEEDNTNKTNRKKVIVAQNDKKCYVAAAAPVPAVEVCNDDDTNNEYTAVIVAETQVQSSIISCDDEHKEQTKKRVISAQSENNSFVAAATPDAAVEPSNYLASSPLLKRKMTLFWKDIKFQKNCEEWELRLRNESNASSYCIHLKTGAKIRSPSTMVRVLNLTQVYNLSVAEAVKEAKKEMNAKKELKVISVAKCKRKSKKIKIKQRKEVKSCDGSSIKRSLETSISQSSTTTAKKKKQQLEKSSKSIATTAASLQKDVHSKHGNILKKKAKHNVQHNKSGKHKQLKKQHQESRLSFIKTEIQPNPFSLEKTLADAKRKNIFNANQIKQEKEGKFTSRKGEINNSRSHQKTSNILTETDV